MINKQDRELLPFIYNSKMELFDLNYNEQNLDNLEKVLCIDNRPISLNFGNFGSSYLFSGILEIHSVEKTCSSDGGVLFNGLQIVIKKYTGELVGIIEYDYLFCNGFKCIDLNISSNNIIKTIHQLQDEKYHIYLNYDNNDKIAMRMELCPGDEDILNNHLKNYEQNVRYINV
ncbi:hypothetical protein C6P40_000699 [Pichia californica]|uniref:Uncharacterized protein n=1 Tax=Pichia californica TaxID=460514 RepID=A0A9P6WKJ5_9ASCO|nr:hypothetical protein C6P40_000699 [[Candida] californica]